VEPSSSISNSEAAELQADRGAREEDAAVFDGDSGTLRAGGGDDATPKSHRFPLAGTLAVLATIAVSWLLAAVLAKPVSGWVAENFGDQLIQLGKGRIVEPAHFVAQRLREAAWLIAVAGVLMLAGDLIWRRLERRLTKTWLWLPLTVMAFAQVNLFVLAACETGLYWMALYVAHPNLKQSCFHTERILAKQAEAREKVYVVGSSQGHSQIHTGQLNRALAPQVVSANLSYSGSKAFDFLMIHDQYAETPPDVVIVYLSELNLYERLSGKRCLPLLSFRELSELTELGAWSFPIKEGLGHGMLGAALPLFRSRRAIEMACFGRIGEFSPGVVIPIRRSTKGKGNNRAIAPAVDPLLLAAERADAGGGEKPDYHLGPESEFNKQALERFIEANLAAGVIVVVIEGQLNPEYERLIEPRIREDFARYLAHLKEEHPEVVFFRDEFPRFSADAYEDFWHITPGHRQEFTARLARVLADRFGWDLAE